MTDPATTAKAIGIGERLLNFLTEKLSPKEMCVMCLAVTGGVSTFFAINYATAGEVNKVREDVSEVQLTVLQSDLIAVRQLQCKLATGDKIWYAKRIGELQHAYRKMTGAEFPIPQCEDL